MSCPTRPASSQSAHAASSSACPAAHGRHSGEVARVSGLYAWAAVVGRQSDLIRCDLQAHGQDCVCVGLDAGVRSCCACCLPLLVVHLVLHWLSMYLTLRCYQHAADGKHAQWHLSWAQRQQQQLHRVAILSAATPVAKSMVCSYTCVFVSCVAGKSSGKLRDNDALQDVLSLMAHDTLLFLSAAGRAHSVKAHKVPEASRVASGSSIAQVWGSPYLFLL